MSETPSNMPWHPNSPPHMIKVSPYRWGGFMLFIDHEFKGIYKDQRKAWKHGAFLMMKTLKKERKMHLEDFAVDHQRTC
jgi:hypothetical protein